MTICESCGKAEVMATVSACPSGLGWMPDGSLLVVSMNDKRLLRQTNGQLTLHGDLSGIAGGPCNDMVVDPEGRAYVGGFGFDLDAVMRGETRETRTTVLSLVLPDGTTVDGEVPYPTPVALRYRPAEGIDFYTNHESRKGRDLAARPVAGMMGLQDPRERQAQMQQSIMAQGGMDMTPEGLRAKAKRFLEHGDQRTAFMLAGDDGAGHLIEYAPTEEIFTNPKDSRTEAYITGRFG